MASGECVAACNGKCSVYKYQQIIVYREIFVYATMLKDNIVHYPSIIRSSPDGLSTKDIGN